MRFRLVFRILFLVFILNPLFVFSAEPTDLSWLKFTDGNEEFWDYDSYDQGIPGRRYWRRDVAEFDYTVVVLIAKKSSSYITAFNTFLKVMGRHIPDIEVYTYNCNKREDLARDVFEFTRMIDADILIAMGSESTAHAHNHFQGEEIPVVTCVNKDPVLNGQVGDYKSGSGTNIAFTSVNVPMKINTEWLFKAVPDLKSIAILYDPDHTKVVDAEVDPFVEYLESLDMDIGVYKCAIPTLEGEDIKDTIREKLGEAFSYFQGSDPGMNHSVFWLTSSTNIFTELETLSESTRQIPVISSVPDTVGSGLESPLMAIGINRASVAELATQYAIEILKGNILPGELPVGIVTPPDIAINFRTAKRIGFTFPFQLFENARFIYGYEGEVLKNFGETVERTGE